MIGHPDWTLLLVCVAYGLGVAILCMACIARFAFVCTLPGVARIAAIGFAA